ncbi:hypothetical protein P9597_04755 [Aneurinibacillus migulanus]|uniref:hypothetical protein n=1 Tax=Aneurinibacillus migulanus TaxID=47500 RepID=UPI002E1C6C66|nr:hypothetical protein [Aneurinibacillus migulanus]
MSYLPSLPGRQLETLLYRPLRHVADQRNHHRYSNFKKSQRGAFSPVQPSSSLWLNKWNYQAELKKLLKCLLKRLAQLIFLRIDVRSKLKGVSFGEYSMKESKTI